MTVRAIVLKRSDSGESDRRLTLLTAEAGKIVAVAKGARKPTSRLAGISDPLSCAVMDLALGKRSSFITQAQPLTSFRGIRRDYERLSYSLALLELYSALIPIEQPQPEAYDLLLRSLASLEVHEKPLVALVWAEIALLQMEGFLPQLSECVVTSQSIECADPFLSPHAGGVVGDEVASPFSDRYRVRIEVLYALQRLPDLSNPPAHLKLCEETLLAVFPFLRYAAESPLPANESLIGEVRRKLASIPETQD